jgi:hypothetical protein
MKADKAENTSHRPMGPYEFGALMLFGLFGAPLVIHLLVSLST